MKCRGTRKKQETSAERLWKLGSAPITKLLILTALENAVSLVSLSLYQFFDSIFVGRYFNAYALAAVSVFNPIEYLLCTSLPVAFSVASTTISSPAIGSDDIRTANLATSQLFVLGTTYTCLIPLIFIWWVRSLVVVLGAATDLTISYAVYYATVMLFSLFVYFPNGGFLPLLRAENRSRTAMLVYLTSSALNLLLDLIIFPFGADTLQMYAPALSTMLALFVTAIYTYLNFFGAFKTGVLRFKCSQMRPVWSIWWRIIVQAFPQFLNALPNCLFIILCNVQIKKFAKTPEQADILSAGIGSYNRVVFLLLYPRQAVYLAFMSIVGFNLGAKKLDRVLKLLVSVFWTHFLLILVLSVIGLAAAEPIVRLFGNDQQFVQQSVLTLRLAIFGTPFGGCLMVCSGIYQMEKRPVIASGFQLSRVVLGTVLIMVFPEFFPIEYIAIAFGLTDTVTGVAAWFIYWLSIYRRYKHELEVFSTTFTQAQGDFAEKAPYVEYDENYNSGADLHGKENDSIDAAAL